MSTAQWIKEAEEQAKKYSEAIKTNNQYLIDQLNASKTNTLEQLQKQQNNALYNINSQKSNIYSTAEDNAGQAYINKVLALKDNEQAMNRAGLGTQGIVGSQVNSINSSYGKNVNDILNNRTSSLNELEINKNNTNTTYDTNRLNLENEYGVNIANTQKSIDDSALNQYNNVYNSVLALKQQEWEREQAEKAVALAKAQWEKEYALQQYNTYKPTTTTQTTPDWGLDETPQTDAYGNSYETTQKDDYLFNTEDAKREGHTRYIGNQKVKSAGLVKNIAPSVISNVGVGGNQNVWTVGGEYYVWKPNADKTSGQYVNIKNYM